jgi:hypothetical protein
MSSDAVFTIFTCHALMEIDCCIRLHGESFFVAQCAEIMRADGIFLH